MNKLYYQEISSRIPTIVAGICLVIFLINFIAPAHTVFAAILAADRITVWNPGMNSAGGIPNRTTICTNISAVTYGNGAQNASSGIQAAIDSCPDGEVVKLSAGDFKITSPILINKPITLRGMGPGMTKLKIPLTAGTNAITIGGQQWFNWGQSTNLASNAVKGSSSVTLASTPSLAVGELVGIDQVTDSSLSKWGYSNCQNANDACRTWFTRPNRPLGQILEVASISGNTVNFTTPFHIDFKTTSAAQLTRFGGPTVKYAGVEDLYTHGGLAGQGQGHIWISGAGYSWVKNVETDFHDGKSISLISAFRSVVRDSYIHSTQTPYPGGGGYGLAVSNYSSDNLIENNIIWNMNKVMVMQASGGGNVIGYNYMDDGYIGNMPTWVEVGFNASHMATPHYELFEGNQSFNFDGDNTWGNAIYITAFRNHLTGKRRSISPLNLIDQQNARAVGLMEGHWWYNIIGNVLGTTNTPLQFSTLQVTAPPWGDALWKLGYNPENWEAAADSKLLSTLIRGGNFDYVTNTVKWEDVSVQVLPNSMYLSTKPAFFGSNPWPWVDPTASTKTQVLPARQRFDALMGIEPIPVLGDINLDHIVNSLDYSLMNTDWFTTNPRSDLNGEGLVNALDYSILNANWYRTW